MRQIKLLPAIKSLKYFIPNYASSNGDISITKMSNIDDVLTKCSIDYVVGDILISGTNNEWEAGECDISESIAAGFVARRWADYIED